ncbi:MAG: hypothetical protein A2Y95_10690 [Deltaproteobacteria bacterium RBG_13_65_10]|jgi:hypothetical protein|nr:MAG: hypothetical protein A2Y95_10690 [Deltaproteobacteria bacterium RBG_13_65_10]
MRKRGLVRVADEVWVATALLHREHPAEQDFTVAEIVERAEKEDILGGGKLRPGVYVHIRQQCVANRPPNPGRYRMLLETNGGRRRLFREGDAYHPARRNAKTHPDRYHLPEKYLPLLEWYQREYAPAKGRPAVVDPILGLRGLGKEIWVGEEPDAYVRRLRKDWE